MNVRHPNGLKAFTSMWRYPLENGENRKSTKKLCGGIYFGENKV